MLQKEVQQPDADARKLGNGREDFSRDEVEPSGSSLQSEGRLVPNGHCHISQVSS